MKDIYDAEGREHQAGAQEGEGDAPQLRFGANRDQDQVPVGGGESVHLRGEAGSGVDTKVSANGYMTEGEQVPAADVLDFCVLIPRQSLHVGRDLVFFGAQAVSADTNPSFAEDKDHGENHGKQNQRKTNQAQAKEA